MPGILVLQKLLVFLKVDKEKLVLLNLCPTTVLIVLRAPRIQTQKNAGPPPKLQPRAAPA